MNDAFLALLCFLVPVLGLGGILTLIIASERRRNSGRLVEELAVEIRSLRERVEQLELRISMSPSERSVQSAEAPQPQGLSVAETEPDTAQTTSPSEAVPPHTAQEPSKQITAELAEMVADAEPQTSPTLPAIAPSPDATKPRVSDEGWEKLLGVRAASALGALVLVLAGLYLFKYSIEHGILTPTMRVLAGAAVGVAALSWSELRLRKRHEILGDWLCGAGIAILYLSSWAARSLYELVSTEVAFGLFVAGTTLAGWLALRHGSLATAYLGLCGGFATPFLLSTGGDHPVGLFSYLLLLNGMLLFIARRRGFQSLAWLCLAGTAVYEMFWVSERMDLDRLPLGLGVILVFSIVYAAYGASASSSSRSLSTGATGVLLPFAFALHFAWRSDLGMHLYPVGVLLVLLNAQAAWLAARKAMPWLALSAACATMGIGVAFALTGRFTDTVAWEFSGLFASVALVHYAIERLARSAQPTEDGDETHRLVSVVTAAFPMILVVAAVTTETVGSPWPWFSGVLVLAGIAFLSLFPARPIRSYVFLALAFGVSLCALNDAVDLVHTTALYRVAVMLACSGFFIALSIRYRNDRTSWVAYASALPALLVLIHLAFSTHFSSTTLERTDHLVVLGCFTLLVAASTIYVSGTWLGVAVFATAFVHGVWASERGSVLALATAAMCMIVARVWPFFWSRSGRATLAMFRASALAPVAWFWAFERLQPAVLRDRAAGFLPALLAVISFSAGSMVRRYGPLNEDDNRAANVWYLAVSALFATAAVPLQLRHEWITVAWALEGAVFIALFVRHSHPGLKYLGLCLLCAVTIRLVLNIELLTYHPRSSVPVLNWLAYTYWIPAAALFAASFMLRRVELERLRQWEVRLYPVKAPIASHLTATAAFLVFFVWVNLTVFDAFGTDAVLRLDLEHRPARDLTLSLSWALYGLCLLAFGVLKQRTGPRVASLLIILATTGKVFLYDLSHLGDLYRVASLLGLSLSLILISVAYQRFVFRSRPPTSPPPPFSA